MTAGLRERGWAEIDGQQRDRPLLTGIADSCLAAITCLIKRRVREPHQYRPRQPSTDVGLHLRDPALQPNQGHGPGTRGRHSPHRPYVGKRWFLAWHNHEAIASSR